MKQQKKQKKINETELGLILNKVLKSTYDVLQIYNPTYALSYEEYCVVVKDYIKDNKNYKEVNGQ